MTFSRKMACFQTRFSRLRMDIRFDGWSFKLGIGMKSMQNDIFCGGVFCENVPLCDYRLDSDLTY